MTPSTTTGCPKCRKPIEQNSKYCANCGSDVSGIWSGSNPGALGGTIAVEVDPNVDTLGQMLSEATLGEYDIYGELGRGGMAAVYLGLDLALNRKVAIKTMLPELVTREGMVQRFKREAQTAAALSHPHIIQIFTVKESKKLVYFVMKFIEGRSLESVITDKGHVPLSMTQTILGQVGSALDYAHKKHVVHRDIKPANIMIDEDGWAIVTDFGIAKVQEAQNLTATGTAIGTPHYMSPEQFHNKAVTGQSDQYSLGVVLYEMLAGKKPFDGGTYAEIITQHLFEPVPDLREINPETPEHVNDVVKKMMAKDPADRYSDLDTAIHSLGAPTSKKEGDVVRTQMISLAKSGPQKKVRMSVPMSPIPVGRQPARPAATQVEARPKKSGAGKAIGIAAALLLLGGGGYYGWLQLNKQKAATSTVLSVTPAGTPDNTQSQAAESSAVATNPEATTPALGAKTPEVDSAKIIADIRAQERKRFADSVAGAERRRLAAERNTKTQPPITKTEVAETKTAVAPPPVASDPPRPVKPDSGSITIGTPTPNAFLYINGQIHGPISSLTTIRVPAGTVKLSIKAEGCQPWGDTTFVMAAEANHRIGRRPASCP